MAYTRATDINPYIAQKGRTIIDFECTIGSSGAVTLVTADQRSQGVYSVTKEGTGLYYVYVGKSTSDFPVFSRFINAQVTYCLPSATPTVFTDPIVTPVLGTSSPTYIKLQFIQPTVSSGPTYATQAANPDSGATLKVRLIFKRGVAN